MFARMTAQAADALANATAQAQQRIYAKQTQVAAATAQEAQYVIERINKEIEGTAVAMQVNAQATQQAHDSARAALEGQILSSRATDSAIATQTVAAPTQQAVQQQMEREAAAHWWRVNVWVPLELSLPTLFWLCMIAAGVTSIIVFARTFLAALYRILPVVELRLRALQDKNGRTVIILDPKQLLNVFRPDLMLYPSMQNTPDGLNPTGQDDVDPRMQAGVTSGAQNVEAMHELARLGPHAMDYMRRYQSPPQVDGWEPDIKIVDPNLDTRVASWIEESKRRLLEG